MTTKAFLPGDPEVTEFRKLIFERDLGLSADHLSTITYANRDEYDMFAYWYCDEKFLSTGFDQILLYYHDGEPVCICGGTFFNKNLYRGLQMYYTLREFRTTKDCNNIAGRSGGFIEYQIARAVELDCKLYFSSVHVYDDKHRRFWEGYLKRNIVMKGFLPSRDRAYNVTHFTYLDKEYPIMNVKQKIMYHDIHDLGLDFDKLFYES